MKVAIVIAGDDTFVCFFLLPQWLSLLLPALSALRAHLSCIVFALASRSNEDNTSMTDGARNVATDLSQHDGVTLSASSRHSPLLTTPQAPLLPPLPPPSAPRPPRPPLPKGLQGIFLASLEVSHRAGELVPTSRRSHLSDLVTVMGNVSRCLPQCTTST